MWMGTSQTSHRVGELKGLQQGTKGQQAKGQAQSSSTAREETAVSSTFTSKEL